MMMTPSLLGDDHEGATRTSAPPPQEPNPAAPALTLRQKGLLAMGAVLGLIALLGALVLGYKASAEADFDALLAMQAEVLAQAPQTHAVQQAQEQAQARALQMRERGRAVAVTMAVSAGLGVVLIGMVVVLFFTQLSGDIGALRNSALAVVGGSREPVAVPPRHDELGDLGQALATLVRSLAAREAELDIERRNAFHHEKMAALGALAAGVLNDIGNPIAAIDGIARAMKDAQADSAVAPHTAAGLGLIDPALILHETARLQVITRQIAQLASAQPSRAQLLSLNDVVRTALLMLHFDPRLSGVRVDTTLDAQLPAVHGHPDRLLQLVMSLTTLAAEAALAPRGTPAAANAPVDKPLINVKTMGIGDHVRLVVSDNGPAMNPDLMKHAFDPQPADAPAPRGAGHALVLCRSIVDQHSGQIRITPTATAAGLPTGSLDGMQVEVTLPLQTPAPTPRASV
ncbi:histidine kinase [Burkholderiales bacterium JOSHI_001]|nr:histidine kinase [Burkholderiales bacterium JOSHI_001]